MWVLESRLYTILKRGILQCYELPSITTFPMVLYPIFDCFLKWVSTQQNRQVVTLTYFKSSDTWKGKDTMQPLFFYEHTARDHVKDDDADNGDDDDDEIKNKDDDIDDFDENNQ